MGQADEKRKGSLIPRRSVLLLSGIPATGKSHFGRYLARQHGFAHYDLECHPRGWPHPELKVVWDASPSAFLAELRNRHERIALDWGFPPCRMRIVEELRIGGATVVWFDGNIAQARKKFIERGGIDVCEFDAQVKSIQQSDIPNILKCLVVNALTRKGAFLKLHSILSQVFGSVDG